MLNFAAIALALISLVAGALIEPPVATAAGKPKAASVAATEPVEGGYRIISEDLSTASSARLVAVTIPHRIGEPEIARIAEAVRAKENAPYEKTIVNLYLPGIKSGHNPWAVAAFQPALKVSILGLRLDEEQAALAAAAADHRIVVGVWLTAPPAPSGWLTIFTDAGKTFAEWHLRNGTTSVEELVVARDSRGRRLTPRSGGSDYYLLGWNGELELRDGASVIATGERLATVGDKVAAKSASKQPPPRARQQMRASASAATGEALSKQVFKF